MIRLSTRSPNAIPRPTFNHKDPHLVLAHGMLAAMRCKASMLKETCKHVLEFMSAKQLLVPLFRCLDNDTVQHTSLFATTTCKRVVQTHRKTIGVQRLPPPCLKSETLNNIQGFMRGATFDTRLHTARCTNRQTKPCRRFRQSW